jgi:hypothetical protein
MRRWLAETLPAAESSADTKLCPRLWIGLLGLGRGFANVRPTATFWMPILNFGFERFGKRGIWSALGFVTLVRTVCDSAHRTAFVL